MYLFMYLEVYIYIFIYVFIYSEYLFIFILRSIYVLTPENFFLFFCVGARARACFFLCFFYFYLLLSSYDNFDAQEERGAYSSSAYAYDGATFGTGGIGGGAGNGEDARGVPQEADL